MKSSRICLGVRLGICTLFLGIGCSSAPKTAPPCFVLDPIPRPLVLDVFPIPGATSVPDNVGVVIYASSQTVPITLVSGTTKIATQPTAVPSPLPSPAATQGPGFTEYAVSVPPLATATTYGIVASLTQDCAVGPVEQTIATFSTK